MHEAERAFVKYRGPVQGKAIRRRQFKDAAHTFDGALRRAEREYKRARLSEIEQVETREPRKFWDYLSKLGPKRKSEIPFEVYDEEGSVFRDRSRVLKKWKEDFQSLFTRSDDTLTNFDLHFYDSCMREKDRREELMVSDDYEVNEALNCRITVEEVGIVAQKAKNGKAIGCDGIPNEVLKTGNCRNILVAIFNAFLERGTVPAQWLKAFIVPVPKSSANDARIPLAYRGISIVSCVSKIFTAVLNNRLKRFLEDDHLLADEQNGFRKGRSCLDHIYVLSTIVKKRQIRNESTFAAFVDFRKAFDFVDRGLLLHALLKREVDGNFYRAVKALYAGTTACVRVNNQYTDWFDTSIGVRQGDCLSPTLFSLFVNDLLKVLKDLNVGVRVGEEKVGCLAYADDLVILAENEADLQEAIQVLQEWCAQWQLIINSEKSNIMHFRRRNTPKTGFNFQLGEDSLEVVGRYRYLGLALDEFMEFGDAVEVLANSAGRALGGMIGKFKELGIMGITTYTKLFTSCVTPIMDYGAGVWGSKVFAKMEAVQNRAMRFFIGVHRFAPIPALSGDMGWDSCSVRWQIAGLRLWNALVRMDDARLCKRVFLYDHSSVGIGGWCAEVRETLRKCGRLEDFERRQPVDLRDMAARLRHLDNESWNQAVEGKPKLRFYKRFKSQREPEPYLKINLSRKERALLGQLRCGILPLHVETGRFRGLALDERRCPFCPEEVEDECHFLFVCPKYELKRQDLELATNLGQDLNLDEKLQKLFNEYPRQLAKYVKASMLLRTNAI